MKKLISAAAVCAMLAAVLTGCGDKEESSTSSRTKNYYNGAPVKEEVLQPIMDYYEGMNTRDPELIIHSYLPEAFLESYKNLGEYDELVKLTKQDIAYSHKQWDQKVGENSYIRFNEQSKNLTLSDERLRLAEKFIHLSYHDAHSLAHFSKGYEVTFDYIIEGDSGDSYTQMTACFVYSDDDNRWYMLDASADNLDSYVEAPEVDADDADQQAG